MCVCALQFLFAPIMATVRLLDIVSDADRAAVVGLRLKPGQDRFVASVEESIQEAAV